MKKVIVFLMCLLVASPAFGSLVTYTVLSSDAGISYTHFNNAFSTIYNDYNGNIDTDNLAEGAVTSNDIATAVNPLVWGYDTIGEYVASGYSLPTSGLIGSANIGSGVAFVVNDGDSTLHRVEKGAYNIGPELYASKENWIYIDFTGLYTVLPVAIGSSEPTTPSNSVVLGRIITDATEVSSSSVSTRQTVPPAMRTYIDYKNGCFVSRDISDVDKVIISRGEIELIGDGRVRRNTEPIEIDFGTTGIGGLDSGSQAASTYYGIYVLPSTENNTNFSGIGSANLTGSLAAYDDERLVGWAYSDESTNISGDSCSGFRGRGGDAPNVVTRRISTDVSYTDLNTYGELIDIKMFCSGRPVCYNFSSTVERAGQGVVGVRFVIDDAPTAISESHAKNAGGGDPTYLGLNGVCFPEYGPHKFGIELRDVTNGSTISILGASEYSANFTVMEL